MVVLKFSWTIAQKSNYLKLLETIIIGNFLEHFSIICKQKQRWTNNTGKILYMGNFGEEKYWRIWRMNHDSPNFYLPNILLNKYRMANCQLFTLQTFIYSTNNYTSSTYKNGANRRDNPQNMSNYCNSLLYSNGRRILRISYLPFAIKQFTITGCTENLYSITRAILVVRPIYASATYQYCNCKCL